MEKISEFSQLNRRIMACFRPNMRTNCALSAEQLKQRISQGVLFCEEYDGGLLLLEKRQQDHLLRYYLTDCAALPPALPGALTCELVLRPGEPDVPAPWWEALGFRRKMKRLRLIRPAQSVCALTPPAPVSASAALALLETCFAADTGCLPTEGELALAADEGRLLPRFSGGSLCALLYAVPARGAVELRHLAVLPEYRGQGHAGSLTEEFVHRFGDRRLGVWVREDLPQAQHIYEKNGFTADGYTAAVWQTERN